jgi:endonuclease/exonuclease/phosphatase family metal-dependent hydrolase
MIDETHDNERNNPHLIVATYNIWGFGEPWRYTADRGITRGAVPGSPATTFRLPDGIWPRRRQLLARCLRSVHPDLVALQEIREDPAEGDRSQAQQLARDLGYHDVYAPAEGSDPHALDRALAILSPHPIVRSTYLPLPPDPDANIGRQTALHAAVDTPVGRIEFVTVHLTPRTETAQLDGITYLLGYLGNLPTKALIVLAGDFNAAPESRSIQMLTREAEATRSGVELRDAWVLAHPRDAGPTMPSHEPVARIDYILVGTGISVVDAVRLGADPDGDGFYPSDHLGLAATLVRNPSPV